MNLAIERFLDAVSPARIKRRREEDALLLELRQKEARIEAIREARRKEAEANRPEEEGSSDMSCIAYLGMG